jgi:hypothetical protein
LIPFLPALLFAAAPCGARLELLIVPYDQESALKRPYLQERANLTLRISNTCDGGDVIAVPFEVRAGSEQVTQGSMPLAPQTGVEVKATWRPQVPGTYKIRVTSEGVEAVERIIEVQPFDTQVLSFEKASAVKAFFGSTSGPTANCVIDATDAADATVRIEASCSKEGQFEGDVRAFDKFGLRNGWRVKSIETVKTDAQSDSASLTPVVMPAIGSDSPMMKFIAVVAPGATTSLTYKITIEGPKGTNPYK